MSAYEVMATLAAEGATLGTPGRREHLWRNVPTLDAALRAALTPLGAGAFLERAVVHVDDPSYRQGAAALVLEYRVDVGDPFRVCATCLVDHGSITLRVAAAPVSASYERARALLEPATGDDGELPLRRLGDASDERGARPIAHNSWPPGGLMRRPLAVVAALCCAFFVFYEARLLVVTHFLTELRPGGGGAKIGAVVFPLLALLFGWAAARLWRGAHARDDMPVTRSS